MINIASYLPAMAARQPDTLAVAFPLGRDRAGRQKYLRWSYQQLEEESNIIARGLQASGITRGMRTVLMVKPSPEFFAMVFAIFKIGAVLVGVDPGMGVRNLKTCLGEAQPEAFIGIRKAHIARKLLGWGRATNRINVLVGRKLLPFGSTIALDEVRRRGSSASTAAAAVPVGPVLADTQPEEMAAILFTSGSTGIPKGVVYTHGNFDAQVRALREQYDIQPGEIDLCTFPLFALFAPALGMSAVVPQMDFTKPGSVEPRDIIEPILEFKVTNMFGSPALLKRVAPYDNNFPLYCHSHNIQSEAGAYNSLPTTTLRRVISAGAPVPARTIGNMKRLLPRNSQVFTPYGATESLPVCSIGSDEILGETMAQTAQGNGVCIGRPVPSIDLRIIRISDEPVDRWSADLELKPGEIGEIAVRGPQVTRSYFNREASTKLAKISCDDGTFFHRMGDLGYRDATGRVWFCGRKSERVVTDANVFYTACCEEVFNQSGKCNRTALVGIRLDGRIVPVILWEVVTAGGAVICPHPPRDDEVHASLVELGAAREVTKPIETFIRYRFAEFFPTDIRHNSKINRPLLAQWAAKKLGGEPA